jgi:rhomboid protease GluP
MLATYATVARTPIGAAGRRTLRLYAAALGGRPDIVEALFATDLRDAPSPLRSYWMATAQWASGRRDDAAQALRAIADSDNYAVRTGALHRLQWPGPTGEVSGERRDVLDTLAREVEHERLYGLTATPRSAAAPVTWALILVNLGFFAIEVPGGIEDHDNLIRLGALLAPLEHLEGEWWRLLTSGFLHFGGLHLLLNVVGIWVLGRYVERVWGRWALGICYVVAMLGANLSMLLLWSVYSREPTVAVGASGGVMGILGAALAFAVIEWRATRAPLLRRHVGIFASILVLQVAFDLMTPKVSSTIHMSGLGIGLLLGLVLALRARRVGRRSDLEAQPSGSITSAPK